MEILLQDVRYGFRMLLGKPGFTLVAIITLAIGIGANTAIFSVINGVLLKSLSLPEPERLVALTETSKELPVRPVAYPNYLDWQARQTVFAEMTARVPAGGVITGDGEPERVIGQFVTASFFSTLGVQPQIGRFFTEEADKPGAERVMVLSHILWQRHFEGNEGIIGKAIRYNGESWTVVGVMPAGFDFYGQTNPNNDFFIPLGQLTDQDFMHDRNYHPVMVTARLKPGVTLEQARAEMKTIAAQLENQYPDSNTGNSISLTTFMDDYVGDVRTALLVITAAVALVLLIACANVANLLLARAASRQKEIAVKTALGASRGRIVRQLLTESALLAVAGGALGLLLAVWGVDLLVRLNPDSLPRIEDITIAPRVLGFTLLVTLVTAVVFGLAPALQTSKVNLNNTLKEGGRQHTGGAGLQRLRGVLVVAEVALAMVLLIGAGLLVKSFRQLMEVDAGFDARNVLTLRLRLPDAKYTEMSQITGLLKEVMRRVSTLPNVEQVSVGSGFPLGRNSQAAYRVEGQPEPQRQGDWPIAIRQTVSEDYHKALGIKLIAGRYFTEHDTDDSIPVVLVDDDFVRRNFPNVSISDALGRRLRFNSQGESWREIVGVVRHTQHYGLDQEAPAEIYRPWLQGSKSVADGARAMDLIVKTSDKPESLVAAIKREVQAIDSEQPLGNVRTLESLLAESTAPRRFSLLLLGIFALVALLLGAVGLYGVMSYAVAQRTREIGIRMALGAQKGDVLRLVIKQGLMLSLGGVAVGLAASFALTRLMESLLFGVAATDPLTFAVIAALLTTVALVACYIPARRATKVDPGVALRYE